MRSDKLVKRLILAAFLLASLSASAQVFVDPPRYATNEYPNEIVTTDFNKDGNWDVATVDNYYVSVLLGKPDGTFQQRVDYVLASNFGDSIVAGDFNGDGYPDLAVVSDPSTGFCDVDNGFLSVFINNGDGTFAPRLDYQPNGCYANGVVTGDFNHDGKLDLAIVNQLGPTHLHPGDIEVFLGAGDGTFQRGAQYTTLGAPWKLVAGDFNNDGKLDLAVSNLSYQPPVSLFLGNGDGTFQQRVDFGNPSVLENESIVAADFNHDGNLDLAVSTQVASVFLGNGDGTFQPQIDIDDAGFLGSLGVGDFNGDGIPDLIGGYEGALAVLVGNGDGSFRAPTNYAWPVVFAAAADFNHDGKLDFVATGGSLLGGVIGVFLGAGNGTFPGANRAFQLPVLGGSGGNNDVVADFNGDGILDIASTNAIMLGNGNGTFRPYSYSFDANLFFPDVTTADFNGDGKPDLAVTTLDFDNQIYAVNVLLGKGDGTFQPPVAYNLLDAGSVVAADVNGDHIPDLIVVVPDGFVDVLLGTGTGAFGSPMVTAVASPGGVIAGDFDGDGRTDLLLTSCSDGCSKGAISFLHGKGDGTFQPPRNFDLPDVALAFATADFNRDGHPDLAVTTLTSLLIFLGNGDGTFSQIVSYGVVGYPIRIADFDGDRKLDIAIPLQNDEIALLLGNGDGTFQSPQYVIGGCCRSSVGDFNADGKPDLDIGGNILLNVADIPSFTFSLELTGPGSGTVVLTPGFVCTASCSHNYAQGARLKLTAKPSAGSTFAGWNGGGCSGTAGCNLTITMNTSVTASFEVTPDFQISASKFSPATVSPGQSATSTINVPGVGGFDRSVALTCSVSPLPLLAPQCSVSPGSISPGTPATLTVTTSAPAAALKFPLHPSTAFAAWLPVLGGMFVFCARGSRRRDKRRTSPIVLLGIGLALALLVACGGGSSGNSGGTPSGNYTVKVKGISGSTQHTTSVIITVGE